MYYFIYNVVTKPNSLKFRAADALVTDWQCELPSSSTKSKAKFGQEIYFLVLLLTKTKPGLISTSIFTNPNIIIIANAKVIFEAYIKSRGLKYDYECGNLQWVDDTSKCMKRIYIDI